MLHKSRRLFHTLFSTSFFGINPDFKHVTMLTLLTLTLWALVFAPSLAMTQAAAKRVRWEDLMVATSKFPRFFGEPDYVSRTDPPKVTGLMYLKNIDHGRPVGPVVPIHCSSDSGVFACPGFTDCDECSGELKTDGPPAWSALQERRSSLGHDLDGLSFNSDMVWNTFFFADGHYRQEFFFTQNMGGGLMPIDNSKVRLGLNKWENGTISFAPELDQHIVYTGEFDHDSTEPTCAKNLARDTAARVAMDQPFWSALNVPEYTLVYTVQDGRLYLAWRLKFDLTADVEDSFFVWVNARDCSEVIAAASEKTEFFLRTLDDFKKEQRRVFKEVRNIDLEPEHPSA